MAHPGARCGEQGQQLVEITLLTDDRQPELVASDDEEVAGHAVDVVDLEVLFLGVDALEWHGVEQIDHRPHGRSFAEVFAGPGLEHGDLLQGQRPGDAAVESTVRWFEMDVVGHAGEIRRARPAAAGRVAAVYRRRMVSTEHLPTSDVWWVRQRVGEGISLVTEPHVHPFLRCNVWHVQGRDADLVVDTGMGIRPLRPLVERDLDGDLIAVATHSHGDHVGGLHEFEHRAIHAVEADTIAEAQIASLVTADYGPKTVGVYETAGYVFDDLLIDAAPAGGVESYYEYPAAAATRTLVDGDVIDLGDRAFEVLHLPGHSPGSIGLWEEASGVLFSGDAIYDGPLLDELQGSDVEDYAATVRRLRQLPVEVVHGGHENSFGRARLVELCDAYLARRT